MTIAPLRAKSWDESQKGPAPIHVFLSHHLAAVFSSAQRVLHATGDDQLRALGLSPEKYRVRLQRCVLLAAVLHDLGKANDHFQGMIYGIRDVRLNPQGVRHEWVTLLMLQQLRGWLLPVVENSELDFTFVEWAVVGHHPVGQHDEFPPRACPPAAGVEITLLMAEPEFVASLEFIRSEFSLGEIPQLRNTTHSLGGRGKVFEDFARWSRASYKQWDRLVSRRRTTDSNATENDATSVCDRESNGNYATISSDRSLLAAIKNSLVAADVAGSVLPKAFELEPDRGAWITQSLTTLPEKGDLKAIVDHRLGTNHARPFQTQVSDSKSLVTLVKAGCGTGKTLAAYMWAAANHPTRRLYFCYPTTGTATEGFKDYLFDDAEKAPRGKAQLFHSRRDVDFEIILETGNDSQQLADESAKRLEALESWSTPIVTCTVDTVLGLVQNHRKGLFAWPALAQSAFVFDEIHAFDDRLFGSLLRFLRDLPGLPALLMTASLPSAREDAIRDIVKARGQLLIPIAGPEELEKLPRYCRTAPNTTDPMDAVRRTLAGRGKVLWVCNTVKRVLEAARHAADYQPLLYHSRFKYEDRVGRHKAVIDAFDPKQNQDAALAICSQVAEMSLDLSADLLITDLATVPALIQRLGRLNRRARDGDPPKPFLVVEPDSHAPYTHECLESARAWLEKLPDGDISQQLLIKAWEQSNTAETQFVPSAWLDGGPKTQASDLRESSPSITVVMDEDRTAVCGNPQAVRRKLLPMPFPRSSEWRSWPRERGIPIAPSHTIMYDKLRGAEWRNVE